MASAADPLTEDYCCAYCLQRLPYMVDPRQLPCSHVFCLSCLKDDFAEISATCCRICRRTHEIADLDTLTAVTTPVITDDIQEEEYNILCDVCTGEKSISLVYCSDCKKNYCQQHHQMHDVILGPTHTMISTKPTRSTICQEHAEEPLTLACSSCHVTFCTSCDTKTGCTQVPETGQHTLVAVEELAKELRREMNSELEKLSGKITEVGKMEKSVWNNFDEAETKIEKLTSEVALDTEQKIKEINQKSDSIIGQLGRCRDDVVKETSSYTKELMFKKENLQSLWRAMRSAANQSDVNLISRQKESVAILKEAASSNLVMQAIKYPHFSLSIGTSWRPPIFVVDADEPTTFLEYTKSWTSDWNFFFWSKEMLTTVKDKNVQIFDSDFKKVKSLSFEKKVMSLAPANEDTFHQQDVRYVAWTYNSDHDINVDGTSCHTQLSVNAQLKGYSSECKEQNAFDSFSFTSSYSTIYSKSFIRKVAVNPERSHVLVLYNSTLEIFTINGDWQYTTQLKEISFPSTVHVLADGSLLVRSEGYIYKYRYHPPTPSIHPPTSSAELIWKSSYVIQARGISVDAAGYIYVRCNIGVQRLSPSGERLNALTHQHLKSVSIRDVCVTPSGEHVAIACGDNTVKVFKMSRQKVL